jgi:hypothetical protein
LNISISNAYLLFIYLGNLVEDTLNTNFYRFDFIDPKKVTWESLTAEQLVPSPNTPDTNSKSISSNEFSNRTALIVGLTIGGILLLVALALVFSFIYRRIKKKKNAAVEKLGPDDQPNTILQLNDNEQQDYQQHPLVDQDSPQHSPKGIHMPIFLIPNSDQNL